MQQHAPHLSLPGGQTGAQHLRPCSALWRRVAAPLPARRPAQRAQQERQRCRSDGYPEGAEPSLLDLAAPGNAPPPALDGSEDTASEPVAAVPGTSTSPAEHAAQQQPGGSSVKQKEVQELLQFAVPALGLTLADPLMSLIDTACVGHVSVTQLAALGPNTIVFNCVFQLFAFLSVATTSTIASNSPGVAGLDEAARAARRRTAQVTLSNALCLAVACGSLATTVLLAKGPAILAAIGTPAEVLGPALQYLRIRALASPAVMVMSVSQGACLGQQDVWTPLSVLLATGLLNAAGDIYLIAGRGAGVAGAAAATAAAQYVGALYFIWHLWRKGRQQNAVPLRFCGLPSWASVRPFLEVASTLFVRTLFGMTSYTSMTAAATRLGTLCTAAHQVAMQTFWFFSYFPEPLSLAAQSLIARDRYQPRQAAQWAWLLLKAGAALGVALAAVVAGIFCWGSWIFTSDSAVQRAVAALAPVASAVTLVCSTMMMCDGISIGAGDYAHLPLANAVGLALTLSMLWAGQRAGLGLTTVWAALLAFYSTRLSAHALHFASRGPGSVFAGGWQPKQQQQQQQPAAAAG